MTSRSQPALPSAAFINARRQRFAQRPSAAESFLQRRSANAKEISPVLNAHGSAIVRNHRNVRPVSSLNCISSPSAIPWSVVARATDTINGAAGGALPHVFKEVIKEMPALADSNSFCSIPRIGSAIRIVATIKHGDPCHIGSAVSTAPTMPMPEGSSHSRSLT